MQFQTGKRPDNIHAVLNEIWLGECLDEAEGRKKIEIACYRLSKTVICTRKFRYSEKEILSSVSFTLEIH
jgi:hypothetical protein